MAKFTTLTSHAVPLPAENVDTDQIIPARFLKVTDKNGLGGSLFCDWRYLKDGSDNPEFVLNELTNHGPLPQPIPCRRSTAGGVIFCAS